MGDTSDSTIASEDAWASPGHYSLMSELTFSDQEYFSISSGQSSLVSKLNVESLPQSPSQSPPKEANDLVNTKEADVSLQSKHLPPISTIERSKAVFDALPANVFQFYGSSTLWHDLIAYFPEGDDFWDKIESLSPDQKYVFAGIIISEGLEGALAKKSILVPETIRVANLHPPLYHPRKYDDACIQVGESCLIDHDDASNDAVNTEDGQNPVSLS